MASLNRFSVACLVSLTLAGNSEGDSYGEAVRSHNAIAYWRLDDVDGRVARDAMQRHYGWHQQGADPVSGPFDAAGRAAARFDGSGDRVRVPHHDDFLLDEGTIAFWFYSDGTGGTQGLLSKDANGYGDGGHLTIALDRGTLKVRLQSANTSYSVAAKAARAQDWYHVVFTFGIGGMRLYLDGASVASGDYKGGLGESSGGRGNHEPLVLGASAMISHPGKAGPLHNHLRGRMSDVALFPGALTDQQVQQLFAAATPSYRDIVEAYALNDPVVWWRLDELGDSTEAIDRVGEQHGQYHGEGHRFDGDDRVEVGTIDGFRTQLSILAWITPKNFAIGDARIISKSSGVLLDEHYWMLSTVKVGDAHRLRFRVHTDRGVKELVASSGDLAAGEEAFVAAVYDGERMKLYRNGTLVGATRHHGRIKGNSHVHAWIGDNPSGAGSRPFSGAIRDVALFDAAISASRMSAIYVAQHECQEPAAAEERAEEAEQPTDDLVEQPPVEPRCHFGLVCCHCDSLVVVPQEQVVLKGRADIVCGRCDAEYAVRRLYKAK